MNVHCIRRLGKQGGLQVARVKPKLQRAVMKRARRVNNEKA